MGIVHHNAVIATTWNGKRFEEVKKWVGELEEVSYGGRKLKELFLFGDGVTNGYRTITLIPDGSNEGWDDSDKGDELREKFIAKLQDDLYSDGSSDWAWVEVEFGEYGQKIVRGNNTNRY